MKQRLGIFLSAVLVAAIGLFASPSPAFAVDVTQFKVDVLHSSGRVAVSVTGKLRWLNRSVTVQELEGIGIAGETYSYYVTGLRRSGDRWVKVDSFDVNYTQGHSYWPEDFTLDAGDVVGGITRVEVYVIDISHNIDKTSPYGRP